MKKKILWSNLLIFMLINLLIGGGFEEYNADDFKNIIEKTPGTLLDVRTAFEYNNGHLSSALQLNYYSGDFRERLLLLPKGTPVYLYCNTGYRSRRAARMLSEAGYEKVYNLRRGLLDWHLQDYPVVEEEAARPDQENLMAIDEYEALIQSDRPVFIDFYAPWCAPCRSMMPMIDSLRSEYAGRIDVVKINVDASRALVKSLGINAVPRLTVTAAGQNLFLHQGMIHKDSLSAEFDRILSPAAENR